MPEQVLTLENAIDELTKAGVTIENPDEVKEYLTKHPGLIEVVDSARKKASVVFEKQPLFLDIYYDPEGGVHDSYLYLSLDNPENVSPREFFSNIGSVSRAYLGKLPRDSNGAYFDFGPHEWLLKLPKTQSNTSKTA